MPHQVLHDRGERVNKLKVDVSEMLPASAGQK